MKKLLLLLLIVPMVSFGQSSFKSSKGTFDYVNGVRYRVIFDEDLDIDSQVIKINSKVAQVSYPMTSAKMVVDKKDGRTRITVTEFSIGDVTGPVLNGTTGGSTEYYEMDNRVWNEKRQKFKGAFVKNYSKKIEKSILQAVDRLIKNTESGDDW